MKEVQPTQALKELTHGKQFPRRADRARGLSHYDARAYAQRWQDRAAFDRHAELPHTIRFVETVEPLLDHPFKVMLAERLW